MYFIKDLKNSNQDTFNQIFYDFHQQLYNYMLHRTKSAYCAEEIVQLTFIKLWNSRKNLSEEIELHIQIFRIAKTTLIDYIRMYQKENCDISIIHHLNNETVQNDTYKQVYYKETIYKIKRLIDSLPPIRRKVFEMSRYKNMTNKEISEKLSIAPKTVENHINLALKYIKTYFWICFLIITICI